MHRSVDVTHRLRIHALRRAFLAAMPVLALLTPEVQATTYTVNNNGDPASGTAANCAAASTQPCMLRDAVAAAVGGDTIAFNLPAGSTTIVLTGGELVLSSITGSVAIDGINVSGAGRITLDGHENSRLFYTNANTHTDISNLAMQNGWQLGQASAGYAGGIFNQGTLMLTNSTVSGNVAYYAGGIYNSGALTLTNSTVSRNNATGSGHHAGGIGNGKGTVTLINSTVSGNGAPDAGGGIKNNATMTLTNSTISDNSSARNGAGIENRGTLTLTNSTVAKNYSAFGAGLYFVSSPNVTLVNTIIDDVCSIKSSTITDGGGNLDSGATCGLSATTSRNNATLNLGLLANNGGPTQTILPGTGSDAINFTPCANAPPLDQRGYLRPDPASAALVAPCDAGAVEAGSIPDLIFANGFGPPPTYK